MQNWNLDHIKLLLALGCNQFAVQDLILKINNHERAGTFLQQFKYLSIDCVLALAKRDDQESVQILDNLNKI